MDNQKCLWRSLYGCNWCLKKFQTVLINKESNAFSCKSFQLKHKSVQVLKFGDLGVNSGLHIIIFDEIDAICKTRGSVAGNTGS